MFAFLSVTFSFSSPVLSYEIVEDNRLSLPPSYPGSFPPSSSLSRFHYSPEWSPRTTSFRPSQHLSLGLPFVCFFMSFSLPPGPLRPLIRHGSCFCSQRFSSHFSFSHVRAARFYLLQPRFCSAFGRVVFPSRLIARHLYCLLTTRV